MTLANRVTLLRIALFPLCLVFLLLGFYGLAAVTFFLVSLSDVIDGYIARKYHQVSKFGKLIDPLADKVLITTALIGLTSLGKADSIPIMIIAARELIIAGIRTNKIFSASPIAKGKTFFQVVAVLMLMLNLPFAGWVLWFVVVLSLISGGAYLWQSRIFERL